MENVEIIELGAFDPKTNRRTFDAVSYETCYWRGRLDFVLWPGTGEGRIYVMSDRNDLGDDYGMRPGTVDEVENDDRAKEVIAKAIIQCFDHTITYEVLSDGNGGWIPFTTDT